MQDPQEPVPFRVNYIYYGLFFLTLFITSMSSIFAKDYLQGSRFFFFLYAVGQAVLETYVLIFLGWVIEKFCGRLLFLFFIGAVFLLFILHIFDFLMVRVLDLSIWEGIQTFVIDETYENFLLLLDASGIAIWIWISFFLILALIPFLGVVLYRLSEKVTKKYPLALHSHRFLQVFFSIFVALLFWDFSASRVIHPDAYTAFTQSLPWKFTFLEPSSVVYSLNTSLKSPLEEKSLAAFLEKDRTVLKKKPNIYLFVVESLRADCITEKVTPFLYAFSKQAMAPDLTLSNANGTNVAWFSLFHSEFPSSWQEVQSRGWKMGSPALNLLKKWGYKIRLYSSANLGYYGMEKLLFGEEGHLLDSYQAFPHAPPVSAAESDFHALEALQKDLQDPQLQEGQLCIVFWDTTHFDYSWPKEREAKFTPFASELDYFKTFYTEEGIELIKNRYRNSVNYMDELFGSFLASLPNPEDAVILFTGDHGEEFLEKGHLFHGSHLIHEQMHIPILLKFGREPPRKISGIVSQMDIFPSLLHYLSKKPPSLLQGESLFLAKRWPYAMIARFNASRPPYEFCLHNGQHKLVLRFIDRKHIFSTQDLHIRSFRNLQDLAIFESKKDLHKRVSREFGLAFHRLFPEDNK